MRRSVQSASGATNEAKRASAIVISADVLAVRRQDVVRIGSTGRKAAMPTKISAGTNAITSAIPGSTLWRKLRWSPRTRCTV